MPQRTNYWKKISIPLSGLVHARAATAARDKQAYIEAAILQAALLEGALRAAITSKVGSRRKAFKKYWDGDGRFSELIDYYELLGGPARLIKRLREYNNQRNRIVHRLLEFADMDSLAREARANYRRGRRLFVALEEASR